MGRRANALLIINTQSRSQKKVWLKKEAQNNLRLAQAWSDFLRRGHFDGFQIMF